MHVLLDLFLCLNLIALSPKEYKGIHVIKKQRVATVGQTGHSPI